MSRRILTSIAIVVLVAVAVGCEGCRGKKHFCPDCGADTTATADQCEECGLEFKPLQE